MSKVYWTMKNGDKIDIDEMTTQHLRNTLKMIVRNNESINNNCPHNIEMAEGFSDEEIERLFKKTEYDFLNEENRWKPDF